MIDFDVMIDLDDEIGTLSGTRDSVLVLLEAARRDLNAMSQALGASPERKIAYGKLAASLNRLLEPLPRVNLLNGVVSSPEEIRRNGRPSKAPEPVLPAEEIDLEDDDDILG